MEKNMNITLLSTYYNEADDRKAEVFKDKYHFGVRMYEKESKAWGYGQWVLKRTELLKNHNEYYAQDLAENYVQKWGAFKDGN